MVPEPHNLVIIKKDNFMIAVCIGGKQMRYNWSITFFFFSALISL